MQKLTHLTILGKNWCVDKLTCADAIVNFLADQGVRKIFSLPGSHIGALCDSVYRHQLIDLVTVRHEQGCGFMAMGYAKSTGKVGVCMVIPGPGLMNIAGALATAYACNAQILCITGQIDSKWIDRRLGLLHEVYDQLNLFRSVTKWVGRINSPEETLPVLHQAFLHLYSGRPGPVVVEIPVDIAGVAAHIKTVPSKDISTPIPSEQALNQAVNLLSQSCKPLIIAGGGAWNAKEALLKVAEKLQAPVILTANSRGLISDHYPLSAHLFAGKCLWLQADVLLAVGTRLQVPFTRWGKSERMKIVRIDIDFSQITIPELPEVALHGDANRTLSALSSRLEHSSVISSNSNNILTVLRQRIEAQLLTIEPQASFCQAIHEALAENAFIAIDSTQVGYFAIYGLNLEPSRHLLTSGYQGTLGCAFPIAVGAKIAYQNRQVVAITGDGGFLLNAQELSTAVQQRLNVVTIVFNDGAYGELRRMQEDFYNSRIIGSELVNPDFVKFAQSFGAKGYRVESPKALKEALQKSFQESLPVVIEVPVGSMPNLSNAILDK